MANHANDRGESNVSCNMSSEDHGQGDIEQLTRRSEAFVSSRDPLESFRATGQSTEAGRQARIRETLDHPYNTQSPPHSKGTEGPSTTGHIARLSASTAPSTSREDSKSALGQSLTTPPTDTSKGDAVQGAKKTAGFLICAYFVEFGSTAPAKCCSSKFKRACDLKQHTWRFHVHIDDQRSMHATALKVDQSLQTTQLLEENPLFRLTAESWVRFVDIISVLNIRRPRLEELHNDHRITCTSNIWRSLFGDRHPGFGSQSETTKENIEIIARSIRSAMDFLSDPAGKDCSKSFIAAEKAFADQRNNDNEQTQQVDYGGTWSEVEASVNEWMHKLSAEEFEKHFAELEQLSRDTRMTTARANMAE
ncbi:hypothetical protein CORC01_04835 [Colletotrichum orchidophilum]|uniref:Uncharacterized protein n=1 Tax=Colletotrichum orchidophilum TaxID=1209926 RepID=A0A1G4BER5_9PEZI|nr:uncharacterized protein CORC01_04835 [Colletotrichum orchidophilum]OHE99934.1 hypothetical protein CORC01_04835 [Colletotrichum orchidophilum]